MFPKAAYHIGLLWKVRTGFTAYIVALTKGSQNGYLCMTVNQLKLVVVHITDTLRGKLFVILILGRSATSGEVWRRAYMSSSSFTGADLGPSSQFTATLL